jgi:hypothetical protein
LSTCSAVKAPATVQAKNTAARLAIAATELSRAGRDANKYLISLCRRGWIISMPLFSSYDADECKNFVERGQTRFERKEVDRDEHACIR